MVVAVVLHRVCKENLECDLKVQRMIGNAQTGKTGLGYRPVRKFENENKERRFQIGLLMKREAERKRLVLLHSYELQNSWLKWGLSDMMAKDLTWNKILTGYSEKLLKFVLNSNLQTLATPDNLKRWNVAYDAPCGLCTKVNVGLSHILAGCPWVLNIENKLPREDRNTWRHNCVLLEFAGAIQRKVTEVNRTALDSTPPFVRFIRAGGIPPRSMARKNFGILHEARDWTCDFHLPELHKDSTYQFPSDVDITSLMCDGYIISHSKRICIILELTVPMEENIEYWHQTKLDKYGTLHSTGWKLHYFAIEIGCRGFVPNRFSGISRQLGFDSLEFKRLRDNLQLVSRKCSYVIWLNRFNKDFNTSFRVSVDGLSATHTPHIISEQVISTQVPLVPSKLAKEDQARILNNRNSALLKLRESRNRKAALHKLRTKNQVLYKAKRKPIPQQLPDSLGAEQPHYLALPRNLGDVKSLTLSSVVHQDAKRLASLWTLLDAPGLSLKNTLNKCWFHAALQLLSTIPTLRPICSVFPKDITPFEASLFGAVLAIVRNQSPTMVSAFYPLVMDFAGINNRYGQVAVPDFIDYLCTQSQLFSGIIRFTFSTRLQCLSCKWVSDSVCNDVSLKLYIPIAIRSVTLSELVDYSSRTQLISNNSVLCGKCNIKTPHNLKREYNPDMLLIEIVRVTELKSGWNKNDCTINFPVTNLVLPGFTRLYRVVATCDHRGSLTGGHWLTNICTSGGNWYELNDLKQTSLLTRSPGIDDSSVVIILLIAEDKLS